MLSVTLPDDIQEQGEGRLVKEGKIFAKGALVYKVRHQNHTELLYRCAGAHPVGLHEDHLYDFDRATHEVTQACLHAGEASYTLSVLDEKITKEFYPPYCGVEVCAKAQWIYDNEVIINAKPFFPSHLSLPAVGKKIGKGYTVVESRSKALNLYGLARYTHEETLHFKMRFGQKGQFLKVPLSLPVDTQRPSFFRENPSLWKTLYEKACCYIDAMRRHSVMEASFVFEEACHITLKDSVTLPSLGHIKGKVIGYFASCSYEKQSLRLKIALSHPKIEIPFSPPEFPKQEEDSPWIEDAGENFIKLRPLRGKRSETLEWTLLNPYAKCEEDV